MAYTAAAKIVAHQALLDRLSEGASGTAAITLYAGATLLATLGIDHTTSSVSGTTGVLTLTPAAATTAVASGTVTVAKLLARDGTILEDAIPFEVGTATVAGKLVLSSLNLISGGGVSMPSLTIG